MSDRFQPYIQKVAERTLTKEEASEAFGVMMSGEATPSQIGGILMALRVRGETVDEISGAVSVMRDKMTTVEVEDGAIDIVGTGGDQSGSFNISTAAAIVAAAAGTKVAKHGNRALSSKSGAADTLLALGVNIECQPEVIAQCVREAGVGFMFAPNHHAAMKHVGPSRVELGTRTIFNLLGPLSNPAKVNRGVIGVFAEEWVETIANVLVGLGAEHCWVVHGDGMDEITVTGKTKVAEVKDGKVAVFEISPEDAGVSQHGVESIKGGDAEYNAKAVERLLDGEEGGFRDMVIMNAGAGLVVAGLAGDVRVGAEMAANAIDSGKAKETLGELVRISNGGGQ